MDWILQAIAGLARVQFADKRKGSLDLDYITPNIIVISMPTSSSKRGMYRNTVSRLSAYLYKTHGDNWRIYNLRSETDGDYKDSEFDGKVSRFPFLDHGPPPFDLIPAIIRSIQDFLDSDPKNVAVIHCRGGKGRSGTIACAYMMRMQNLSRDQAIEVFTAARMPSIRGIGFRGVSIESQRRYLSYYEKWLTDGQESRRLPKQCSVRKCVQLDCIKLINPKKHFKFHIDIEEFLDKGRSKSTVARVKAKKTDDPNILEYRLDMDEQPILLNSDVGLRICARRKFIKATSTKLWFNFILETQPDSPKGSFTVPWEEVDGIYGTSIRGIRKMFNSICVQWTIVQ
ncbi:Tep1p [Sugiyamaella lignohabitans]|uniref:phosphatidylinositol-3,4,5-trisphosphate 3-phosphatase n=1 Tax=Sugiyamaella lignohabitans TaxID=796027 RepID=A0A167DW17_9ASCO|nr:Tep1p [Sugiyamaella lignohabitans]ANB13360.1 Tep1p [Sugiyamaella lignohabitans]